MVGSPWLESIAKVHIKIDGSNDSHDNNPKEYTDYDKNTSGILAYAVC